MHDALNHFKDWLDNVCLAVWLCVWAVNRSCSEDFIMEVPVGLCNFAGNFVDAFCMIMGNFTWCSGATLMKIKQELFLPQKASESPFRIVSLIVNSLNLFQSPVGPQIIDPRVEKDSWIDTIKQLTQ